MPVSASAVGTVFEPRTVTVTPRMILAFAAGLGCTSAKYLDDTDPNGLIAPAPFCVSLEWLISGDPTNRSATNTTEAERLKVVHASQDTQFHRPLRAGETVTVSGAVTDVSSTRAGALVTSRLTIAGAGPGDLISTSQVGSIYRGVSTDAAPRTALDSSSPISPTPARLDRYEVPIARNFPHIYSECAEIWNPIHTERKAALAAGLPDIIVHGTALWALAWKRFDAEFGSVTRLAGRFSAMAIPGWPTLLIHEQPDPQTRSLTFTLENHEGQTALSAGRAEFGAP